MSDKPQTFEEWWAREQRDPSNRAGTKYMPLLSEDWKLLCQRAWDAAQVAAREKAMAEAIRRDRREQAAPVLPLVRNLVKGFANCMKHAGNEEEFIEIRLKNAHAWLAEAEKGAK